LKRIWIEQARFQGVKSPQQGFLDGQGEKISKRGTPTSSLVIDIPSETTNM
jgi:hypothetical protein